MTAWDQLTADEKKMFIRQADVYAAYLAYTDHEIGRVIQAVEDLGLLDNTLIIYISGDNGSSAEGVLVTQGGRFGGWGFYLLKGKPVYVWNLLDLKRERWEGPEALTPGKHTLEFDFKYDGLGLGTLAFNNMSGLGRSGTGTLKVDGKAVQTIAMPHTLPMILQWDESFDIGSDTLTGVNDADYQPPFTFTGKLNKLTIKVDRPKVSPEDIKKLEQAQRNNRMSE